MPWGMNRLSTYGKEIRAGYPGGRTYPELRLPWSGRCRGVFESHACTYPRAFTVTASSDDSDVRAAGLTPSRSTDAGRGISKTDPAPTVLCTRTEPWWASAIAFTIARPSPNPPSSRLRPLSTRANRSKMRVRSPGGIPGPESATARTTSAPSPWAEGPAPSYPSGLTASCPEGLPSRRISSQTRPQPSGTFLTAARGRGGSEWPRLLYDRWLDHWR